MIDLIPLLDDFKKLPQKCIADTDKLKACYPKMECVENDWSCYGGMLSFTTNDGLVMGPLIAFIVVMSLIGCLTCCAGIMCYSRKK